MKAQNLGRRNLAIRTWKKDELGGILEFIIFLGKQGLTGTNLGLATFMKNIIGSVRKIKLSRFRVLLFVLLFLALITGFFMPGVLLDHYVILHFSAHYGTSFFLTVLLCKICQGNFSLSRTSSFIAAFFMVDLFIKLLKSGHCSFSTTEHYPSY